MTWFAQILLAVGGAVALGVVYSLPADETDAKAKAAATDEQSEGAKPAPAPKNEPANADNSGLKKITKDHAVYLDLKRKAVVIDGEVCLREGQLEMFACPKGTKEHESVVSLNCTAEQVHAALLAVGAKPGTTVKFDPEYKPATGPIIDVLILWLDEKGEKHKVRAQEWVKYAKTEKEMPFDWVFAGSGFWTDEDTGKVHYMANSGDLICVSNFNTATLDLPVESSQANASLLFTAFTERIPPRGTKIRVVLIPRAKKEADAKPADAKPEKNPEESKPTAKKAE
ncbi:MAG: YdjY domain-containing protein [Pirellulaceae bacterium]